MAKKKITTEAEALAAVKKDGMAIALVPPEFKTFKVCLAAVRSKLSHDETDMLVLGRDPLWPVFDHIPEEHKTHELYLAAMKYRGWVLPYMPPELITLEICCELITAYEPPSVFIAHTEIQWNSMLQHVPEKFKTEELCRLAVEKNPGAIKYVPEKLLDNEFFLKTAKAAYNADLEEQGYKFDLRKVPRSCRTAKLCMDAVKMKGAALKYVPDELRTAKLCMTAVNNDINALEYVPAELRNYQFYLAIVRKNGIHLKFVPEELITDEICLAAVKHDSAALRYVPEKLRTDQMCIAAVKKDGKERIFPDFRDCESITKITIPDSVTIISNCAFYGCKNLTSVTIPDSVTSIGAGAFQNCKSLTEITIPDSVTSIGDFAFYGCESLTKISIPDSVKNIGNSAFR